MSAYNLVSFLGLGVLVLVAWALSSHRRVFNARAVVWGIGLQLAFGALVFAAPFGARLLVALGDLFNGSLEAAMAGARFCFGPLASRPFEKGSIGFILLFQALPSVVFFATIMQVLYYVGIMPLVVRLFARVFTRLMRISGAESLCAASNVFVGIEASATVRPYLERMTVSELCTVLTTGLATIASSVLGLYVTILRERFPDIAAHLMSASILAAPAALVMSKLVLPETGTPATLGLDAKPYYERESNVIEAAIAGATAGGRMVLGIVVLLLAFLGLVELANMGLDAAGRLLERQAGFHGSLRMENLLAYVYYPFAVVMGVPLDDAFPVAKLLGMRTIVTEVPAYQELDRMIAAGVLHHGRSVVLATYALCGFAHVASVAVFVGGTAALAPSRTGDLARVAFRALLAATLACLMTAHVAGTFYGAGAFVLKLPPPAASP